MILRYLGTIRVSAGEDAHIYASPVRHVCSAYCRGGSHAELLYRADADPIGRDAVQAIADLAMPGLRVLDVRRATEAPLPAGYRAAWLVTYGRRR